MLCRWQFRWSLGEFFLKKKCSLGKTAKAFSFVFVILFRQRPNSTSAVQLHAGPWAHLGPTSQFAVPHIHLSCVKSPVHFSTKHFMHHFAARLGHRLHSQLWHAWLREWSLGDSKNSESRWLICCFDGSGFLTGFWQWVLICFDMFLTDCSWVVHDNDHLNRSFFPGQYRVCLDLDGPGTEYRVRSWICSFKY